MPWIEHFTPSSETIGFFVENESKFGFNLILQSPNIDEHKGKGATVSILRDPKPMDLLKPNTLYIPVKLMQHCVGEDTVIFYFAEQFEAYGTTRILRCEHITPLEEMVKLNEDYEYPEHPTEFVLKITFTPAPEKSGEAEVQDEAPPPHLEEAPKRRGWLAWLGAT